MSARVATAVAALGGAAVICRRALLVVTVRGASMEPGLDDGDRVLLVRSGRWGMRRGDVVVLTPPVVPLDGPDAGPGTGRRAVAGPRLPADLVIKRVAALPGDRLPEGVPGSARTVPDGTVIVLGDRPDRSADSRSYGPVPWDHVVGRVAARLPRRGGEVGGQSAVSR